MPNDIRSHERSSGRLDYTTSTGRRISSNAIFSRSWKTKMHARHTLPWHSVALWLFPTLVILYNSPFVCSSLQVYVRYICYITSSLFNLCISFFSSSSSSCVLSSLLILLARLSMLGLVVCQFRLAELSFIYYIFARSEERPKASRELARNSSVLSRSQLSLWIKYIECERRSRASNRLWLWSNYTTLFAKNALSRARAKQKTLCVCVCRRGGRQLQQKSKGYASEALKWIIYGHTLCRIWQQQKNKEESREREKKQRYEALRRSSGISKMPEQKQCKEQDELRRNKTLTTTTSGEAEWRNTFIQRVLSFSTRTE